MIRTAESALKQTDAVPGLRDDEPAQTLIDAIDLSLEKFAAMAGDAVLRFGGDAVPVSRIIASLNDFRGRLAELGLSDECFR